MGLVSQGCCYETMVGKGPKRRISSKGLNAGDYTGDQNCWPLCEESLTCPRSFLCVWVFYLHAYALYVCSTHGGQKRTSDPLNWNWPPGLRRARALSLTESPLQTQTQRPFFRLHTVLSFYILYCMCNYNLINDENSTYSKPTQIPGQPFPRVYQMLVQKKNL